MTNNEVNKIISEYTGAVIEHVDSWDKGEFSRIITNGGSYQKLYTESLDALVPVWNRLKLQDCHIIGIHLFPRSYKANANIKDVIDLYNTNESVSIVSNDESIQEAAAHATAKAILALGKL